MGFESWKFLDFQNFSLKKNCLKWKSPWKRSEKKSSAMEKFRKCLESRNIVREKKLLHLFPIDFAHSLMLSTVFSVFNTSLKCFSIVSKQFNNSTYSTIQINYSSLAHTFQQLLNAFQIHLCIPIHLIQNSSTEFKTRQQLEIDPIIPNK